MPRNRRLELPGALYHIIVRGIERRAIFIDDADRKEFLQRLAKALAKTGSRCYAWALMYNHFHLLIQSGKKPISDFMRRLMSGYVGYFNRRHHRVGYLVQNRYKSILCQEDVYFKELVRYIHLNPLRSGVVMTIAELNNYLWTGHSDIVGTTKKDWYIVEEVLSLFGEKKEAARKNYLSFIEDGRKMGRRADLIGGGLKRSAGGWSGIQILRKMKTRWQGDERILGDGEFVTQALKEWEEEFNKKEKMRREGWNIDKLIKHVCQMFSIKREDIKKKGKNNSVAYAKELVAYWGKQKLGFSGVEIGKELGISRQAVSLLVAKGEKLVKNGNYNLTS